MSNGRSAPSWIEDSPWQKPSLVLMVVLYLVGLIGIWICYGGCRDADRWSTQVSWILGAVVFAGIGVLGIFSWLLSGRRELRAEKRLIVRNLAPFLPRREPALIPTDDVGFWVEPRMQRFHLSTCLLVRGKQPSVMGLDEVTATGRTPCGVCRPLELVS